MNEFNAMQKRSQELQEAVVRQIDTAEKMRNAILIRTSLMPKIILMGKVKEKKKALKQV